jgi:hypothetical protein
MQKVLGYTSIFAAVFFCVATLVFAHGSSFSHEETKDGYLIDIGYDEFIAADESVRFDFTIYPENIDAVEIDGELFTDVWVTITQDKKAYFAGGVNKPIFGATGFTYAFPKEGEYILSARFQKDGETVVATEFPLTIIPPLEKKKELPPFVLPLIAALAGACVGFAGGLFIPKK